MNIKDFYDVVNFKTLATTVVFSPLSFGTMSLIFFSKILVFPYSLPNIVRVVKSRRMRWAEYVARMGEDRVVHRVLVAKPEKKEAIGETKM
jgi:hypothetical protein